MSRLGKTTHKYYSETRGMKVSGGQKVKSGTMLTRDGHKWKPGKNVIGINHLTARCDGEVYFTKRKSSFSRIQTVINIRPIEAEKAKPAKKAKAQTA